MDKHCDGSCILFSFFSASEISVAPDETEHPRERNHSADSFSDLYYSATNPEEPLLSNSIQVTSYNSFKNSVSSLV